MALYIHHIILRVIFLFCELQLSCYMAQAIGANFTHEYRLVGGKNPYEGRLEVSRNGGEWGTISFKHNERLWGSAYKPKLRLPSLVCRSLGFHNALSASAFAKYGSTTGPVHILTYGTCPEDASSIFDCDNEQWDDQRYIGDHSADVGLVCLPANSSLSFRLAYGDNDHSGIVEVFNGASEWGYICGLGRNLRVADAICRHLGYPFALTTYTISVVSHQSVFVSAFSCSNAAVPIEQCTSDVWFVPTCPSSDIAGVVCFQGINQPYKLRIAGTYSGVLQSAPLANEEWRQLCFRHDSVSNIDMELRQTNQNVGQLLCSDINNDGRYKADFVDNCSPLEPASEEHNVYATVLDGSQHTNASLEMKPLGEIVAVNGTCEDIGYQAVVISCVRDVVVEDVLVRYYQEFSCESRCGFDISAIYCHCDPDCVVFKDCCFDYHQLCSADNSTIQTTSVSPGLFTCFSFDNSASDVSKSLGSFLLVARCPSTWIDSDIRFVCENDLSQELYHTNIISHWPVFDQNGNNYKNIFCALCNDKPFLNISPWNVEIKVHIYQQYQGNNLCSKAGVTTYGNRLVGKRLRHCIHSTVIDSCPGLPSNISTACESYSAITCLPGSFVLAKNIHCAICNGFQALTTNEIRPCSPFQSETEVPFHSSQSFEDPIFHSLWSFSGSNGNNVESDYPQCVSKEEIFDPFSRKCRTLSCSPGYGYDSRQQKCQKIHYFRNAVNGMCCTQQQTWIAYVIQDDLNEDCVLRYLKKIIEINGTQWQRRRVSKESASEELLHANNSLCNIGDKLDNAILKTDYLLTGCNKDSLDYLHICGKNVLPDNCKGAWFKDAAKEFRLVNYTHLSEVFQYKDTFILPSLVIDYISYNFNFRSGSFIKTEMVLVCGNLMERLECSSMVTLTANEYDISRRNTSHITVLASNLTLAEEEFILLPYGRVQICSSHFMKNGMPQVFKYFGNLDMVNIVGSSVSLVAFVLVFGMHCKSKVLRETCHGRSIMYLSVNLFCAYLFPILTQKIQIVGTVCFFFGFITHYSWLSVFSWFTVISIGMTYAFVVRPLEQRDIREASTLYRFILPIYGWGAPVVIVLVCLVVDLNGLAEFSYGLEAPCWISGRSANLVAFGIPVGVSLLVSSLCYVATAICVCRSDRQMRRLEGRDKIITWKDVVITLKMSILMGIGWILGFLASFSGSILLWWTFICITSFYGIFLIFGLCFTNQGRIRPDLQT